MVLSRHHSSVIFFFFFFNDTATTEIYTLSLHDALPISVPPEVVSGLRVPVQSPGRRRSGESGRGRSASSPPAGRSGNAGRATGEAGCRAPRGPVAGRRPRGGPTASRPLRFATTSDRDDDGPHIDGPIRGPEHGGHGVRARGETIGRERDGLARPAAREYDLRLERTDRAPGRIGEGHRERVLEDDREHVVAALDLSRD